MVFSMANSNNNEPICKGEACLSLRILLYDSPQLTETAINTKSVPTQSVNFEGDFTSKKEFNSFSSP
ncbi:MAG: hypothetical protein Phog2KO_11730 [Phototrophicaceae bacterium]